MKKEYASPKAEKMEFNYSEVVVASGSIQCGNTITYSNMNWEGDPCTSHIDYKEVRDVMP